MVFLAPEGRQWNCSRCLALSPFRKGMALCFTHGIRFLLALTWKCLLTFACFYAHLEDSVDWPLPFELNRPSFLPIGNSRSQGRKSYSCRRYWICLRKIIREERQKEGLDLGFDPARKKGSLPIYPSILSSSTATEATEGDLDNQLCACGFNFPLMSSCDINRCSLIGPRKSVFTRGIGFYSGEGWSPPILFFVLVITARAWKAWASSLLSLSVQTWDTKQP